MSPSRTEDSPIGRPLIPPRKTPPRPKLIIRINAAIPNLKLLSELGLERIPILRDGYRGRCHEPCTETDHPTSEDFPGVAEFLIGRVAESVDCEIDVCVHGGYGMSVWLGFKVTDDQLTFEDIRGETTSQEGCPEGYHIWRRLTSSMCGIDQDEQRSMREFSLHDVRKRRI